MSHLWIFMVIRVVSQTKEKYMKFMYNCPYAGDVLRVRGRRNRSTSTTYFSMKCK